MNYVYYVFALSLICSGAFAGPKARVAGVPEQNWAPKREEIRNGHAEWSARQKFSASHPGFIKLADDKKAIRGEAKAVAVQPLALNKLDGSQVQIQGADYCYDYQYDEDYNACYDADGYEGYNDPSCGFVECGDLSYSDLEGVRGLRNASLRGINFTGSEMSYLDFSGADLTGADFTGAHVYRAKFVRAYLDGSSFYLADAYAANFSLASATSVQFQDSKLQSATLAKAYLNFSDFRGAHVGSAKFNNTDVRGGYYDDEYYTYLSEFYNRSRVSFVNAWYNSYTSTDFDPRRLRMRFTTSQP